MRYRIAALASMIAATLSAQTAVDSAHTQQQRISTDSIAQQVQPILTSFCQTKTARSYPTMCRAISLLARQTTALVRAESILVAVTTPTAPPPIVLPPISNSVAGVPELPRSVPASLDPYPDRACKVTLLAGADIYAALKTAQGGDVVCLMAATKYGAFDLPARANCDTSIVLRTNIPLPSQGTRVSPFVAAQFAKILGGVGASPVLRTEAGACGYVLRGLEFGPADGATLVYSFLQVGGMSDVQTTISAQPHHLILSQLYVHGSSTMEMQRCIALNAANIAIVDSYFADCHGKGYDSQVIGGWNGTGPYLIANNSMEGVGENILFGGAWPGAEGLVASDVTIIRNHIYTPPSWKGVWTKKMLLELKVAHRVLVEGNVLDGSWADGQTGFGMWIKSSCDAPYRNQNTDNVTVRLNRMIHIGAGIAITGRENYSNPSYIALYPQDNTHHVLVENNSVDSVNVDPWTGAANLFLIGGAAHAMADIALKHNTMFSSAYVNAFLVFSGSNWPVIDRLDVQSNFAVEGWYGVFGDNGYIGTAALERWGSPYTFPDNVFVRANPDMYAAIYPTTTHIEKTLADGTSVASSIGAGANIAAILAATKGVVQP